MDICKPYSSLVLEKKINKKLSRGLQLINKDLNTHLKLLFPLGDSFSKNVVIVNGGLTTGLDETALLRLLTNSGFTTIEKVIIVPYKQYCFVCFGNTIEAYNAVKNLSGKMKLAGINYPLYLGCVNEVPDLKNNIVFDYPPGLKVFEEFITREEEILLAKLIDWENLPSASPIGSALKNRQVRHFGYEFKYGSNSVDRNAPLEHGIPEELQDLCQRFVSNNLISIVPDQLTVNRYFPGQGIPSHVDTHQSFTGEILSLSIIGGATMDFYCHLEKCSVDAYKTDIQDLHYAAYLPSRSLCVMSGPSRYQWMHGICSRKTDVYPDPVTKHLTLRPRQERISFTFRKIREDGLCRCSYPLMCDSQSFKIDERPENVDEKLKDINAMKLEQEHVLNVYENIADHFNETRHKAWPKVAEFVESQPVGTILLDVGCGNGKYLSKGHHSFQIGCDTSLNLLGICAEKQFEVTLGNCLNLPFKSAAFDAVICIAVIHHLASQNRRLKAVTEILRVLRIGGRALVYVWAMEQKREKMSTYLKQKRSNRRDFSSQHYSKHQTEDRTIIPVEQFSGKVQTATNEAKLEHSVGPQNDLLEKESIESFDNSAVSKDQVKNIPQSLLIHQSRTEFVDQDMFVPWKIKPKKFLKLKESEYHINDTHNTVPTFHRYYHVFKEDELESLFNELPYIKIIESYYDEGNWCIIVEKIDNEFALTETRDSLTECKSSKVTKSNEVVIKAVDHNDQLLSLHDIEVKAEQLAKFIVSVTTDSEGAEPIDHVEETLLRCTNAMISQHEIVFRDLVTKLNISNQTAYISFIAVFNELFEGGKTVVTWGRIVALYAFGSQLALYCKDNNLMALQEIIPLFIGRFAKGAISNFVLKEGGWKKLCEVYPKENIDNQVWRMFMWTAIGLCLTVMVSSFISRK